MTGNSRKESGNLLGQTSLFPRAKLFILLLLLVCLLVMCYVLYFPHHIGASDNADYSRYANVIGINGTESFSGDSYPYFYKFYDKWQWLPFSVEMLSPFYPQVSNVYLVSLIRLITNIFGDTAENPYMLWYLSLVCIPLLLAAFYLLLKFCFYTMGRKGILIIVLGIFMLLGSVHLCWLHSFYGEAMIYVWLIVLLGCSCGTIMAPKGSTSGRLLSVCALVSMHMMLTAKAQTVIGYPIWFFILLVLLFYHWIGKKATATLLKRFLRIFVLCILIACMLLSGLSCLKIYQWNSSLNEKYTLYNSLFTGLLPIVDDPEETLIELGLDPILAQNTGKSGYAMDIIASPVTTLAEEMVLSKINTFDIIKYYIKHPVYLYRAMQISAENARQYFTWLFLESYTDGNGDTQYRQSIAKFGVWEWIRPYLTPGSFVYYVLLYLFLLIACIVAFIHSSGNAKRKMMILLYMGLMLTGIIQFPLSYIGNGVADPTKQMYLFMLSYDLTILVAIGWGYCAIRNRYLYDAKSQQLDDKIKELEASLKARRNSS